MLLLIFVITVVLTGIGFFSNQPQSIVGNTLITHYIFLSRYVWHHVGWFGAWLGFTVVIRYIQTKKGFVVALNYSLQVFLLGFLLSAFLLYFVAIVELNIMAVLFNNDPIKLGVVVDVNTISETLKKMGNPPEIIASNIEQKDGLIAVAQAAVGRNNYFGNLVIPNVPKWLIMPVNKPKSSLLLIDNTLVVTELRAKDMQVVSPIIGYLFVSRNFSNKVVKSYPKIMILNQDDYQNYRRSDFKKKILDIDKLIIESGDKVSSFSATVKFDEEMLKKYQDMVKTTYSKLDSDYQICVSGKKLAKEKCEENRKGLNEEAATASGEIDKYQVVLDKDKKMLDEYKLYRDFLLTQTKVGEDLMKNIPHELGAFDPPETIRLTMENTKASSVADYFETLTHEYMHYASHISEEKKFGDTFWEESLTEYFARNAIQNDLKISTNLGYPAAVKVISKIAKRIPDVDLAAIYFSKDQELLQKTLDKVYGDNFYKNNKILFNTMQYASSQKQLLQMANIILSKIGGEPLTEKDLLSTFSNLN